MMPVNSIFLVLGDQLSESLGALLSADKEHDIIFMCEVREEALYVKHHKKKIAFLFSAMRHFAQKLELDGYRVVYTRFDDPENTHSFDGEVKRLVNKLSPERLIMTFPGEQRVLDKMLSWQHSLNIDVEIRDDDRFLTSPEFFKQWASGRKELRMEFFYREVRKSLIILMEGNKPVGDKWNFDADNRGSLPKKIVVPKPLVFEPDAISKEVMALVAREFADHFGELEPFYFAVTRAQALQVLESFVEQRLPNFGNYQDAMKQGEPWLFHSHVSFYLNCGLLLPEEVVRAVESAYYQNKVPLNAAEGFIRQVAGWREYVRGFYWLKMPEYKNENFFNAKRKLPDFFWNGSTSMNCLKQCVNETSANAYAHHIQRLMILGNFALLAMLDPDEVNEWYLLVYADAYEWVELPNVSGMVLFADGGELASKPYISSGNYINKMSDYCSGCKYNVREKNGASACPFNYLYWNFLLKHKDLLHKNARLRMPYVTLGKMADDKLAAIRHDSQRFLAELDSPD